MDIEDILSERELAHIVQESGGQENDFVRDFDWWVRPEYGQQRYPSNNIQHQQGYGSYQLSSLVKRELYELICTNNHKYADLRKKLNATGGKSQTTIISMIAAGVASSLGLVEGALVPVCAYGLLAIMKVGKNVFCASCAASP